MRLKAFFFALGGIGLLTAPTFAKGPFEPFSIGNWQGGSFTNDETGAFSHCAASVPYQNGMSLFVAVDSAGWRLGFLNNGWRLVVGQNLPIQLRFDGGAPLPLTAIPLNGILAVVPMPVQSTLMRTFMDADRMDFIAGGNVFPFNLEGSLRVFPLLADCAKRHTPQGPPAVAQERRSPKRSAPRAYVNPPEKADERPSTSAPPDAEAERSKLISEAAAEHSKCLRSQMRQIVPYSSESAETLAQVVITKCEESEQKFVSLGMALFNASRAEVEKIVSQALEKQKKKMVADIVSFRAEINKSIMSQPKSEEHQKSKKEETGI
ncbi:hypothetical protein [Methylocystis sp.]|uniref:hypothetical protein n=1 Tax=Methylocystis sp. TaxID=1911079 RepID=UPI003D0D9690